MAANMLSQDFLGICLLITKGNINLSLREVISLAENFQMENNRYFGICAEDFNGMIISLFGQELGGWEPKLAEIPLRQIIPTILRYHDVHLKDTESFWSGLDHEDTLKDFENFAIEYWNRYSKEEYSKKLMAKLTLKKFFAKPASPRPEIVRELMKKLDIEDRLLHFCSRSVNSG